MASLMLRLGIGACLPAIALALPLEDYNAKPGDTLELFVSGSSAQDNGLQRLFRIICEPDSLDVYRTQGARLSFCRARGGRDGLAAISAGRKIAFHKSSAGGSGSGVGPLIRRTVINFINVQDVRAHFDARCPAQGRVWHGAEGAQIAYTEYACSNPVPDAQIPDAGVSDVEPRYFLDEYGLPPESLDQLTVHSANAFIFGVPVSLRLRDALQAARFSRDQECNPSNPRYSELVEVEGGMRVKRGETEPCMPSLSRAQMAGIFSGVVTDWGHFIDRRGYALAARDRRTGQISSPPGVKPPSDDRIYVCRRVRTSGTQAAYEMFFLNARCAPGVPPFIESGDNVFQGSVSEDVESCLGQIDARNAWAVGILTTESVESLKETHWRFIKMDGVAPTLLNTFNGRWPFFVEQTYQWRNEHSEQPLVGEKLALMAQVGLQLSNPAMIRALNRSFRHAWGNAGVMALGNPGLNAPPLPVPGHPVDAEMLDQDPILAVRHDSNNCSAVVAQYPTEIP